MAGSKIKCRRCGGTGYETDVAALKQKRIDADVPQHEMARRMGISKQYLCDLESGRRDWDAAKLQAFAKAMKRLP